MVFPLNVIAGLGEISLDVASWKARILEFEIASGV